MKFKRTIKLILKKSQLVKTGLTEVKIGKVTPEVNVYENTQIKTQGNTLRRRH